MNKQVFRLSWLTLIPHLFLMAFAVGVFTLPIQLLRILTTRIEVDHDSVRGEVGILNKSIQDSKISRIQSVRVDRPFWGRILGYGNVKITTAGDGYLYKGMANPEKIRTTINANM